MSVDEHSHSKFAVVLPLITTIVCLVLSINILFDPIGQIRSREAKEKLVEELVTAREYLPVARAKWKEQNIKHYSFEIGTTLECNIHAWVEVNNGRVVRVIPKHLDFDSVKWVSEEELPPSAWGNNKFFPNISSCHYSTLTVPLLFDEAEIYMKYDIGDICVYKIAFDPTFNFVSSATCERLPQSRGLLSPRMSGHFFGFGINNFQMLGE